MELWLKFTRSLDGEAIYLNMNRATSFWRVSDATQVDFAGDSDQSVLVKETPQQLITAISIARQT